MKSSIHVLLLGIEEARTRDISQAIAEANLGSVYTAKNTEEALQLIREKSVEVVLCDGRISGETYRILSSRLREDKIDLPFVLLAAPHESAHAPKTIPEGIFDYMVLTDHQLQELPHFVQNVHERFALEKREREMREEISKQRSTLQELSQKLSAISIYDDLTGIYNHRYFYEKLIEEFARAKRYAHTLSCLLLDLDYFKAINDVHGHAKGDLVLKEIGQLLSDLSRRTDVVARYGGEEFVMLLPHVGYEGSRILSDRLRKTIEGRIFLAGDLNLKVTVSIGVSAFPDDGPLKADEMILFAEKALNRAKAKGRNSVWFHRDLMKELEARIPALKISGDKIAEFRNRLLDISENSKRAYIESTKALVYALEAKDKHTLGHAARVGQFSAMVAKEMGMSDEEAITIEHAGLLHDIGKVCISDEVLLKEGPFTLAEYEQMKDHPVLGYQMVKPIKFLSEEALIILHHHEWYNGSGYPHRLKGKEIPIGARVVALIDSYDTMRAAGARYKKTMTCEDAVREIIDHTGVQFDPEVVAAFIRIIVKRGEIKPGSYDEKKLNQLVESCK